MHLQLGMDRDRILEIKIYTTNTRYLLDNSYNALEKNFRLSVWSLTCFIISTLGVIPLLVRACAVKTRREPTSSTS